MITRIWHGKVKSINAEKYLKYVEETGVQAYKEIQGNLSIQIGAITIFEMHNQHVARCC